MKITHNKIGQNINVADNKSEKASDSAKASSAASALKSSDVGSAKSAEAGSQAVKLDLSSRAKDIQNIKDLASNSPDVDMEKVEKFKRLISEGKYKVDAKAVADRMVDEHMMSRFSDEE
jgi:negative regulator of flagellin synthesis FlgM